MVYRVIGLMSGSSLDGLDIAFVEFNESGGKWTYDIKNATCIPYDPAWLDQLKNAVNLSGFNYQLLHTAFGKYVGALINQFISHHQLEHQVQLISSHGHTVFHAPLKGMTAQLGDGASIAAITGINVVSDLRAIDVALGGQGAPIVPVGEKLLLGSYDFFLNLGGIANISFNYPDGQIAFDVCAANRVLDMLAQQAGKAYDDGGRIAAAGKVHHDLLARLNGLAYYKQAAPKSLDNSFGVDVIYPLIQEYNLPLADAMRTYAEHIITQIVNASQKLITIEGDRKMLVTGGGAHNSFLIKFLKEHLSDLHIEVIVPDDDLINYKEALIMALIGILRWREEYNVFSSVTGATRNSINGAVWMGQEA